MDASGRPIFTYEEESQLEKLARKSKDSPFLMFGLAGLVTALGVGVYKYKRRGAMTTSMFLMQLRVVAQGMVVGTLTIGMIHNMLTQYVYKDKDKENKP